MTLQVFFKKTRKEIPVDFSTFPGGEEYVRAHVSEKDIDDNGCNVVIEARITSSQEMIRYLLLANALMNRQLYIVTFMPYFPYARQDRICRKGESASLHLFNELFYRLVQTENLKTVDLHSDAILNRWSESVRQEDVFKEVYEQFNMAENEFILVAPDLGAVKKICHDSYETGRAYVTCDKVRNEAGEVTGVKIVENGNLVEGNNCLIVDDICDGGATFIGTAKALLEAGAKSVSLYVTHGIFSKGFGPLKPYFENIYTTNSFYPRYIGVYNEMNIHVFDVFNYLWENN